jgi:membrane-anchored protein YejM (alkaline phosphatase superfamily)
MLYGLHGSYWFPVLEQRRPPVLLEVLQELGYERRVFSSASMNFPRFRDTAWVGLEPGAVQDEHGSRFSHECDVIVGDKVEAWLEDRDPRTPFFGFVLLDAPHQPYYSPPGGPFQPAAEELDYLELAGASDPGLRERVFNRNKNSVLHADGVAGRILDALEANGQLENTLVVVTGDHGEEFLDCGFWGHTSNFSPAQLHVPLFMRGPGIAVGVETRPTSHLDLPTTLLELLGADPAQRSDWTLGENLLDPPRERTRVVAGWSNLGLWSGDEILRIPQSGTGGEVEVFDKQWRWQGVSAPRLRAAKAELDQLERECMRFMSLEL